MVEKYLKNIKDCYTIFKIVGIYRPKGVYIGHRIYGFISRLFLIDIFLLLQCLYFSRIGNINDFADLVSMQLTYVGIATKSYILINNFEKLEEVVAHLKELLEFSSENHSQFGEFVNKRMTSIRKVFKIYWSTCPSTIFLAFLGATMSAKEPPYNPHYKIYPPWFFNFEQNYAYFLIIEVVEYIGPVFAATSAVAMDFLGVFFFSMGAGLLEELSERIALIKTELKVEIKENSKISDPMIIDPEFEKLNDARTVKELKHCIKIHAKIKKFLVEAQKVVSPIIFVQIVISTAVICMTAYTISMYSPLNGGSVFFRQITYMIPMVLQIYIPCFYGNEIMIAAEKFSMDLMHTKWYHGCKKFRNSFKTLLIHATQPIIMICGIIFEVTLENFVTVSQLTYKFYAVMKNMNAQLEA